MPSALTYPGVYIEEVSSGVRTITGVATSIALFVGWAGRGPVDRAVRISSFSDYQRAFGPLDQRSLLGYSVMHFFTNGGADAYVLRLAGTTAEASKAVFGSLTAHANSPGLWGDGYTVRVTLRQSDATRFTLEVLDRNNNAIVESFENLSMNSADPRYAASVINGTGQSGYISVTVGSNTPPTAGTRDLGSGVEGDVLTPSSNDFHTPLLASFGPGSITDRIDLFNLLCVPGETHPDTLNQLQAHCKARRALLIADAASTATVAALNTSGVPDKLVQTDVPNAAYFFPWVQAADPLQEGRLAAFPPCGFVAGVFARTDSNRGVWKAPAGSEAALIGASGLAIQMSDAENGWLNPKGINCLRLLPVYGNVVWGARTVHGQSDRGSEWKYVPVRRMALFLEETLFRATKWVVFEPNDEPLWAQIRLNIGAFLQGLFRQGAFQGRTPREAYFVKCDRETTTQAHIDLGIVNILVGFAPLKPAEFVVLRLQQIAGDLPT